MKAVGDKAYKIECQLYKRESFPFCYQLYGAWCGKMFKHLWNDKCTVGVSKRSQGFPSEMGLGTLLIRLLVSFASSTTC